jgi:hypothetical protein
MRAPDCRSKIWAKINHFFSILKRSCGVAVAMSPSKAVAKKRISQLVLAFCGSDDAWNKSIEDFVHVEKNDCAQPEEDQFVLVDDDFACCDETKIGKSPTLVSITKDSKAITVIHSPVVPKTEALPGFAPAADTTIFVQGKGLEITDINALTLHDTYRLLNEIASGKLK